MRYDALVSEQNSNLLNYIAATVETLRDQIETVRDQMATKADLAALREQMATKAELAVVKDEIVAIKANMATKADIAAVKEQMATKVETAAIRGDIEQVQLRLDSIDRALSGRMGLVETEVSRLRSVVYLLVKDKPDMLRLLGQSGLHENRPPS
jgi:hypothetical protein